MHFRLFIILLNDVVKSSTILLFTMMNYNISLELEKIKICKNLLHSRVYII